MVTFISIAFQIMKLKDFCIDSEFMKWPLFRVFLGPFYPNYCLVLLKFWPEVVSNKKETVLKIFFKTLNVSLKIHRKFIVLFYFEAQFTTEKPKLLLKTKISAKTTSLGKSNSVRPRSQKNHRILVKLKKKKTSLGPNMGLNCPLCLHQSVIRNSLIIF